MIMDENTIVGKEGKRVKIMGGTFEGVEGVIVSSQFLPYCT